MAAIDDLNGLLVNLPGYELITDTMKSQALAGALVPDSFDIWPGLEGYEATYDVFFAAAGLLGFLEAQPVLRSTSSEGTSASVDAPKWGNLRAYYLSNSRIHQSGSQSLLGVVPIPDIPHVYRVVPEVLGGSYDNVDTDLG